MFLAKPLGLLALLDEESRFPGATDYSLIGKRFEDQSVLNWILSFKTISYHREIPEQHSFGLLHPTQVDLQRRSSVLRSALRRTGHL